MLGRSQITGLSCAAALVVVLSACGELSGKRLAANPDPPAVVETGTHWAAPPDFALLKRLGHQFAVVSLDRNVEHWSRVFDAAEAAGIRLIAGLHPYAYHLKDGHWEIEPDGKDFIEYAQSRSVVVKALYGFSEPYWVDPATGKNAACGAYSSAELRDLRSQIRQIWPQALIYHDFGRPSLWAPGGSVQRANSCVGARYADATETADYAGVWFYPVNSREGYRRDELVRSMRDEVAYVFRRMRAEPIVLGQAFACRNCADGTRLPTIEELRDLNCTLRWIAPQAISWYAWRQPAYQESLAGHRELWGATGPKGCADAPGD